MKGKKIGIFTASTPIGFLYPRRLERAVKLLENKGYHVIKGELITKSNLSYRSGTISERVREINILLDKNVDILLSAIGGLNSISILPYLPYDRINQKKIIVCGFSDTTAILNAVIKKCPMARAIYSPSLVANFGADEKSSDISFSYFEKIIFCNEPTIELKPLSFFYETKPDWTLLESNDYSLQNISNENKKSEWKVVNLNEKQKIIEGILFGGNGSTLCHLLGSDYIPQFPNNGILFVEDAEKTPGEVERIFASLMIHGFFNKAKAIILGKHLNYDCEKIAPWEILKEILDFNELKIPIIYDVDVSHFEPMLSLELNKLTKINFINKSILQYLK